MKPLAVLCCITSEQVVIYGTNIQVLTVFFFLIEICFKQYMYLMKVTLTNVFPLYIVMVVLDFFLMTVCF